MLTIFHLRKLYKDFTKTNIEALRVHRLFSIAVKTEKQVENSSYSSAYLNIKQRKKRKKEKCELNTKRFVVPCLLHFLFYICLHPQDCEDLLSITPPQSVKIQQYIRHLETEGIARVKMYMIITTAYLIFWAPLFLVNPFSAPALRL